MNNILGGILAYAEVLHAEAKSAAVREDLSRIRSEAERGAALTRSLLAFSRRGAYRKRAILLHSVLDDMMPLLARTLGRNVILARVDGRRRSSTAIPRSSARSSSTCARTRATR